MKSIIHAGGESTRLREIFEGPKALAPLEDRTLLWFHLQPLLKSNMIDEYVFTLRHQHEKVQAYVEGLKINSKFIVERSKLGRAGSIRQGIEEGLIDVDESYLMSNPDDFIPIDIGELSDYSDDAQRMGKSVIMVMARYHINPFGIGMASDNNGVLELKHFKEKPELPLIDNHFANTGMILFMPEVMKEFRSAPLDRLTHPEHEIMPRLVKSNKVAVFLVDRWIPVNYSSEYKEVIYMGKKKLLEFLEC
jgi:NDP-sugar pyrophosphorylase family protein